MKKLVLVFAFMVSGCQDGVYYNCYNLSSDEKIEMVKFFNSCMGERHSPLASTCREISQSSFCEPIIENKESYTPAKVEVTGNTDTSIGVFEYIK